MITSKMCVCVFRIKEIKFQQLMDDPPAVGVIKTKMLTYLELYVSVNTTEIPQHL